MDPSRSHRRFKIVERVFLVLVVIIAARLVQVQAFKRGYYRKLANSQWEKRISLPALRGDIFDRNGKPLAITSSHYKVCCSPSVFNGLEEAVRDSLRAEITAMLGITARDFREHTKGGGGYAVLHEGRSFKIGEVEALARMSSISLEKVAKRIYPLGMVGAPLLGFVNSEGRGVAGVEAGLQGDLAGRPGEAVYQKDASGRPLIARRKTVVVEPVRGRDIFLTIDGKAQAIADVELAAGAEAAEAVAGSAVVLDPHTGDILALASYPAPASRHEYEPDPWKLLPVQAVYEPGSTMKALSAIALIEHAKVTSESQEDAEDGVAEIEGFTIRDDRPHYGFLTFKEAFRVSSNICFAKFALRLSDEHLFGTYQKLGFGNRYGLNLPGEENGRLRKPGDWSGRSRLTLVFGQEISATPLQMAAAYGALATGGMLVQPRILRATGDKLTGELELGDRTVLRRACEPETASLLLDFMGDVIENGTGTRAAVPGIRVGGKTGTAQKFEQGALKRGKYVASFIGVAPLDDPRLVVAVFLDEPAIGMHHGGQSAAPIFSRIVEKLAITTPYLRDADSPVVSVGGRDKGVVTPMLLEMTARRADSLALRRGLKVTYRGRGRRVVAQEPSPGAPITPDGTLTLILGDPESPADDPPDLLGKSLREARRLALERGYRIIPRGRGVVVWQGPPDPDENLAIPVQLRQTAERGAP